MTVRHKIESSQDNARSQQHATQEQKRRLSGPDAQAYRPSKAAEEDRTERDARDRCQHQREGFSGRHLELSS